MNRAKSKPADIDSQTVCLVDDDPMIRTLFSRVIQRTGCNVVVASCAGEAEMILAAQEVHMVLSDLRMPDSVDGENLLRKVAQDYPATPICMMSGDLDSDMQKNLINLGAMACIIKPFTADTFCKLLAEIGRPSQALE